MFPKVGDPIKFPGTLLILCVFPQHDPQQVAPRTFSIELQFSNHILASLQSFCFVKRHNSIPSLRLSSNPIQSHALDNLSPFATLQWLVWSGKMLWVSVGGHPASVTASGQVFSSWFLESSSIKVFECTGFFANLEILPVHWHLEHFMCQFFEHWQIFQSNYEACSWYFISSSWYSSPFMHLPIKNHLVTCHQWSNFNWIPNWHPSFKIWFWKTAFRIRISMVRTYSTDQLSPHLSISVNVYW